MMKLRKAFTLVEIIIAMFLMMIVILSIFMLNQSSTKSSMDAYYEMLAFSLAREPIEIFRGLGFENALAIARDENKESDRALWNSQNPIYAVGQPVSIEWDPSNTSKIQYPVEAELFNRDINLEDCGSYVKITVQVTAKDANKAEKWLRSSKKSVTLESTIMERPR